MDNNENDTKLIKEFLEGNDKSFETVVNLYLKSIYNFSLRFSNNTEEANDITQEVFLKVWKNIRNFDTNKKFKTWIFTIARNTIIDWMRKKKSINFSRLDTEEETFESTLSDPEPLQDEIFERKELKKDLEKALAKIESDDKVIVLLHNVEGLTFEEIAEVIGKPMNTVKSQYRRALIELRGYLL